MSPIDITIAQLLGKPSPKVEWLLGMGPIAKRLNAESLGDCADAHRRHSAKPEPEEVSAADAASVNYRKGDAA